MFRLLGPAEGGFLQVLRDPCSRAMELRALSQCPSEWLCNRLGPPGDGSHREEPREAGHSPLNSVSAMFPQLLKPGPDLGFEQPAPASVP